MKGFLHGIINALKLFRNSWMEQNTEAGILMLKRQKQTVFEKYYQTSCFISTDWQNFRTQLLIIDALFSNYLGASEPVQGELVRRNHSKAHHPCDDFPNHMPVLAISPNVLESMWLNGTIQQCVDLSIKHQLQTLPRCAGIARKHALSSLD